MAATIARAQGFTKQGNAKNREATRLGGGSARAQAATWRTFATVNVNADGSGYVHVEQNGKVIHSFEWDKE